MQPARLEFEGDGDLALVADAYGEPGRPPVLLLHGGGQTRHAWGGTAEGLARDGWYALSLDLRGHGDSGWADDGDYAMEAFVADLVAVARGLSARPVVVGASLGGITALLAEGELAAGLVAAVVLVDITPRVEPEGVERIIAFMSARPEGFANLEEAADAVASYLPHRPRPASLDGLRKNLRRGPDGRYRWHWDPRFMTSTRVPRATSDPDRLRRAARSLRVPTLLVRGKLSELVSEEAAREFLDDVPHAQYSDVSNAGHMVAGDRNDLFTSAVLDFLRPLRP
jgi:pimeloyl-ACP methyl ester carboxylesterase